MSLRESDSSEALSPSYLISGKNINYCNIFKTAETYLGGIDLDRDSQLGTKFLP